MSVLQRIAERRILEAIERGELDHLPGAGRPLRLDDDRDVPPALRAAYRVLGNAGFVPPELALVKALAEARAEAAAAGSESQRRAAWLRLEAVKLRLETVRGRSLSAAVEEAYRRQLGAWTAPASAAAAEDGAG
jgi:hypothetical protein